MGFINFSIPKELVTKIINTTPIDNFIETGTFQGGTSFWAAKFFKNVYTIEIDPEISRKTSERIDCPSNIKFLVGDSKDILPQLVEKLNGSSFFWLDGHWCFGAGGKDAECPVLDEIISIKDLKDPIIFIDDARCFLGPLPPPHKAEDWPGIDEIFALLKQTFPNHYTTIQDDVIICVPATIKNILDQDWMENFDQRFNLPVEESIRTLSLKIIKRIIKKITH